MSNGVCPSKVDSIHEVTPDDMVRFCRGVLLNRQFLWHSKGQSQSPLDVSYVQLVLIPNVFADATPESHSYIQGSIDIIRSLPAVMDACVISLSYCASLHSSLAFRLYSIQ